MNTSNSEYYKKQSGEFFLGGIYSSTEHAIESIGKTLAPSRKPVVIDENETTMLLDEMGLTFYPSDEYRDFVDHQNNETLSNSGENLSAFDENLEIFNLLMYGHDGKRLPPYAYRKIDYDGINYI